MSRDLPTGEEIRAAVVDRLRETAGTRLGDREITADTSLRDDLGLDSLDAIMLVLQLEEAFDVDIDDDELAGLDTVGELFTLIEGKRRTVESGQQ